MKSCILRNAYEDALLSLMGSNLDALGRLISYNAANGIRMFRISSDLILFGSSLGAAMGKTLFKKVGIHRRGILRSEMRVSMHPGQYTVLNSIDGTVAERAARDPDCHAKVLDSLGLGPEHRMILHLGETHGDRKRARERFVSRYRRLDPAVKKRLVLENDDKLFNIEDVLETASAGGCPRCMTTCTIR